MTNLTQQKPSDIKRMSQIACKYIPPSSVYQSPVKKIPSPEQPPKQVLNFSREKSHIPISLIPMTFDQPIIIEGHTKIQKTDDLLPVAPNIPLENKTLNPPLPPPSFSSSSSSTEPQKETTTTSKKFKNVNEILVQNQLEDEEETRNTKLKSKISFFINEIIDATFKANLSLVKLTEEEYVQCISEIKNTMIETWKNPHRLNGHGQITVSYSLDKLTNSMSEINHGLSYIFRPHEVKVTKITDTSSIFYTYSQLEVEYSLSPKIINSLRLEYKGKTVEIKGFKKTLDELKNDDVVYCYENKQIFKIEHGKLVNSCHPGCPSDIFNDHVINFFVILNHGLDWTSLRHDYRETDNFYDLNLIVQEKTR